MPFWLCRVGAAMRREQELCTPEGVKTSLSGDGRSQAPGFWTWS